MEHCSRSITSHAYSRGVAGSGRREVGPKHRWEVGGGGGVGGRFKVGSGLSNKRWAIGPTNSWVDGRLTPKQVGG